MEARENKLWTGELRPVTGQETQQFSLAKYLWVKGTTRYFIMELEVVSDDAEQSRAVVKTIFADSFIGKKLERDITNHLAKPNENALKLVDNNGVMMKKQRGSYLPVSLGGEYDIHVLKADGTPLMKSGTQDPMIIANATTENQWLFVDEPLSEASSKLKGRVKRNFGEGKRYRACAVSTVATDKDIDAVSESGAHTV